MERKSKSTELDRASFPSIKNLLLFLHRKKTKNYFCSLITSYKATPYLALRIDHQLPQGFVDDRVEECEVVEPDLLAQDVLEDVPVEEEGT